MQQFTITGMSCAACSARIEKAVSKLPGVTSCSVSLLTNSMSVDGSAKPQDIIKAVEHSGYGASLKGSDDTTSQQSRADETNGSGETHSLRLRLISSIVFLVPLMYLSMGHMMWGWYVPDILADNHIAMGLIELLLTAVIMVINQRFFISGFKSLFRGAPNMDTLVSLGAGASFIYSTYALFAMTNAQLNGDMNGVMTYMHEFYFESAAMILTLITLGKMLEAYSKGRTTDAIKSLMSLAPKTAVVIRNGEEQTVPVEQVRKGDIFLVRPGENIPVDGVVLDGETAVNESALTGESIPVDKQSGDAVSAATINQSGFIRCEATKVGQDTTLSQIIKMVSDASATKAPIAKIADRVSGVFVPIVIAIAVISTVVWLVCGQSFGFALARGISVLVISCPCALGLATPVAIMVGGGIGAKHGILFKTAQSLEEAGKVRTVALDKTGTITSGKPRVTDIIPADGVTPDELMKIACSLEIKSEHPLARAIIDKAEEMRLEYGEINDFKALTGSGVKGTINGQEIIGGNLKLIGENAVVPDEMSKTAEALAQSGKTPLFFSKGGVLLGIVAVADVIKEDSPEAVRQLRNMGIRVVMLTGDNEHTANAIGKQAGVDEVIAGVLPDGKGEVINRLKEHGKVAMVGDGINDAPALTSADVGVAIGAGTDIAIDAADVVLMKSRLSDVPAAIRLSRATLKNIHENLFWAFIYNVIGIPLAAGVFIAAFGWKLNPMYGAAAMSLSSVCVVTNALRLNLFKVYNKGKDRKFKRKMKEKRTMKKTLKIEGMMCPHCEATVRKALEELSQVESAEVSHEKGLAVVTLSADVSDELLRKTVEDKGYKVLS
ncbi:MAG: heavy metal translocating P-type ATPase [Acutalibacteraceae bacterium]